MAKYEVDLGKQKTRRRGKVTPTHFVIIKCVKIKLPPNDVGDDFHTLMLKLPPFFYTAPTGNQVVKSDV